MVIVYDRGKRAMNLAHRRVVVIDDSRLERAILIGCLAPLGFEIIESDGSGDCVGLVLEKQPDLIILDLIMARMDGIEICRHLKKKEETRLIPVVMVTGYTDRQARIQGIEAGADDFLMKPVDRVELLARVKSLLKVREYHEYARKKDYYQTLERMVKEKTAQLEKALVELQGANVNLTEAYLDTIYRLSIAAEYRDEDTAGHIKRISHYSAEISRQLGLPGSLVEDIFYASPLHDVGKIGVPDHILLRPGKLKEEDWEIMKSHTVIGAKILGDSDSKLLQVAEQIALSHHEKYDGTGYPAGLAGQNIPLVGRIAAMADVFDALTSKRVYKPVYTNEEALKYIEGANGKHFDPEVTQAFFSGLDNILEIQREFQDETTLLSFGSRGMRVQENR
ncbi:MAG TPA: response regulator [Clostridia bacterium]|nr:response regulator [Clostridia bacterium]